MAQTNDSTLWHLVQLSGASLLAADYATHHFAPHYHEELAIGVIQRGRLHVQIGQHSRMTLRAGDIVIINPEEIHEGYADEREGCAYCMFYLPITLLGKVKDLGEGHSLHFVHCAVNDTYPAQQLTRLYQQLTTITPPSRTTSTLESESCLLEVINHLTQRYAENPGFSISIDVPNVKMMHEAQVYLAAHCHQKISLETLSAQSGLSPYHFLRTFKSTIGMTPHAFQMQMRIDQAKAQLIKGESIAQVAVDLGFHDQSHLTRQFKAVVGVTPQRYRQKSNFLQDTRPAAM